VKAIVSFFDKHAVDLDQVKYLVMVPCYQGKLVIVRHRDRATWEMPGGHRETGEGCEEGACRELREETGARRFSLRWLCAYSVTWNGKTEYGQLFRAEIKELGELPESEIAEIRLVDKLPENLTYPHIQPAMLRKALEMTDTC
jgi:8-oxo-dGTP diphosphatase